MSSLSSQQDSAVVRVLNVVGGFAENGIGNKVSVQRYTEAGQEYEELLNTVSYNAPVKAAEVVSELFEERGNDIKIVDIGAGTGLGGVELKKKGFTNIDAVDASEGMLEEAKKKGVYNKIICQFVGDDQPMPYEDGSVDVVTIAGAIGENHIPSCAFRDIVRIIKKGGFLVNVYREAAGNTPWYVKANPGGLESYMAQLEKEGLCTLHQRSTYPNFFSVAGVSSQFGADGLVLIHKKL